MQGGGRGATALDGGSAPSPPPGRRPLPLAVEKALLKKVPPAYLRHAHHWLILHGRYICKARKPRCPDCKVAAVCNFKDKTAAA